MSVPLSHLLRQGPSVAAVGRALVAGLRSRPTSPPATPTARLEQQVPARSSALIADFVRWSGGDPARYDGVVPPHLFPQWGLPLAAQTLADVPYDLRRVLNGGCKVELRAPIPAGEPLNLAAWLQDIDDDGRRAVLQQRLVTGTASVPEAVVCTGYAIVPLKRGDGPKKERPTVPDGARSLKRLSLSGSAGREFAILTGDVNPVHWLRPAAKLAGFPSTILHGYGTLALAMEALAGSLEGGVDELAWVDVRFTTPLVLPRQAAVFIDDAGGLWVGTEPGAPAFMVGSYGLKERASA